MAASTIFTGARALLKLAQSTVGYVINCAGTTGINYQALSILGHLEVIEHVPVAYTVELTASLARVANVTRLATGDAASFPGTLPGIDAGVQSPQVMPAFDLNGNGSAILTSGEMQADIFDRVTNQSLYTVKGVKCSQKAWEIAANGMVAENCTFVARIGGELSENTTALAS